MIINKAQGRSLKEVDIDSREECFSHGQLYVACLKCGSETGLHILAPIGETDVVYEKDL
jgi:ribosomal protein S27E